MPLPAPIVGIIANPASGRDLRRLTANAGLYSSTDKASAIQRLLAAFGVTGIGRVLLPSDMTGIAAAVLKASQGPGARDQHWPAIEILDLPLTQTVADTRLATRRMVERGVAMIAVLGGDGTHKAVAAEAADVPLLTLSTGTNNAFPELREATSAGLAGGLYASGRIPAEIALRRNKRLLVREARRGLCELALVDVAVSSLAFVGARAISRAADLAEVFVTFAEPQSIGLSALCGLWLPVPRQAPHGAWMRLDPQSPEALLVPLAPGLLQGCGVAAAGRLEPGVAHGLALASGTLALDGEREIEFNVHDRPTVTLDAGGPLGPEHRAGLGRARVGQRSRRAQSAEPGPSARCARSRGCGRASGTCGSSPGQRGSGEARRSAPGPAPRAAASARSCSRTCGTTRWPAWSMPASPTGSFPSTVRSATSRTPLRVKINSAMHTFLVALVHGAFTPYRSILQSACLALVHQTYFKLSASLTQWATAPAQ